MIGTCWTQATGWQAESAAISRRYGISPVAAMFLANRFSDSEAMAEFLDPCGGTCPPPERLPNVEEAARVIAAAVRAGQTILVHGDYDVDGLMGAAVLMGGLAALGGGTVAHIPSRFDGGYGLSETSLEAIAKSGAGLVVTTDCGTNAREIGEQITAMDVGMVITDHHIPSENAQPPAIIVNPHIEIDHPDRTMCGAYVAMQTVRQVARELKRDLPLDPFLRLVAIATVADVVPMTPDNRRVCKQGFRALTETPNVALAMMLKRAKINGDLRSHHIAYHIAPRFNAAGRMKDGRLVLDLLLERHPGRASILMGRLESLNRKRKALQAAALEEATMMASGQEAGRVLFAASDGWHRGVIGPVAARLAETFRKSAFVVAVEGDEGVGSARAAGQDNVVRLLEEAAPVLLRFGGHQGAAGFTVSADRIDELGRILRTAEPGEESSGLDEARTYFEISPDSLQDVWDVWGILDPFGPGNEEPYIGVEGLHARGCRMVGDRHVIWDVGLPNGDSLNVIAWDGVRKGLGPSSLKPSAQVIAKPAPEFRPGRLPFCLTVEDVL